MDEVSEKYDFAYAYDDDEVYQGEESGVMQKTPSRNSIIPKLNFDAADDKSGAALPLSHKHSSRYLPDDIGNDLSARGNNILCDSDTSGVNLEDSHRITQ